MAPRITLGTDWNTLHPAPRFAAEEDLRRHVRAAAERFVAELEQARRATDGWRDGPLTEALASAAMTGLLAELITTGCWGEASRVASGELWRVAGPVLEAGSLQRHARAKPHGYAGDWEMMTRIWEQSLCEHPLGRAFDRYFLRQAAPQAVRARLEQAAVTVAAECVARVGRPVHVVSVGAGPAIDVAAGLAVVPATLRQAVRVTLLDLDPVALEVAGRRVGVYLPAQQVSCVRTNLNRLARLPAAKLDDLLGRPDLLLCTGLFDYLADDAAGALLGCLWRRLAPGGRLWVGNFAPHNPTRAYMEWIGNWYLIYRTAEALAALAARAGLPADGYRITSEWLGVDLFIEAEVE